MLLFPAIDLYDHKVVRLVKGDYAQMTVYSEDPLGTAKDIEAMGGRWLHLVDLEGAKDGTTPNFDVVSSIAKETGLNIEIGGGIRSFETIDKYLSAGVSRVILGTKAVTDKAFLEEAVAKWGEKIAVGVDAKDGKVAVKGWLEVLDVDMFDFLLNLRDMGVKTAIVTDISRDGAMKGTNLPLYDKLSGLQGIDITASGGVSTLDDLRALKKMDIYGAILGKAMYNGAIKLEDALKLVNEG
ncbi:1-(5-phosphoribosyl)-5-[(5-phosphoribosylamino)methylideneamino]imidazole-4-carboxamide isomerase [Oribacterium sp. WCC10]|uniref:1-(5-phosphoribosyl)-5-[(5- phosphoribosylamino)methylideneamino]imidazole-4- carboxamide isomerase n=1 Tax=Oribacterium sp. WCC10 TaxID=1855343 RepID=UPI0008E97CFF|nr:1-(5-phosphoribosyl)-5-[(5-phosphoribosylamino)methylideneamino]imidazole-4-carboxamide isomerase [Oribacterium sp. WCC10]SFG29742.1 1-(5-phosphoribosyl)-5-[(5-phosphoribosylamino)methylideneamino] imidazole-4-carboxamide isomerase [Oribacterium sp. WCC10]